MAITVTINQLQNNYKNYLQAANSNINANSPNTYWDIQSGAMAGILLDLYYNLQLVENSIYPQNSIGNQIDLWLYSRGLPARGGQTFATISCDVTTSTPITITENTIFTDSVTQNQYQNLQSVTIPNNSTQFILYSLVAGIGYYEPVGNTLTSSDGTIIINVISSTDGQEEETDQSCINRILTSIQAPISGARQTDYQVYCLQANSLLPNPVITDSIVIPSFVVTGGVGILGVFPLQGTPITEYQLNQGLLPTTIFSGYTRQSNSLTLSTTTTYIQNLRLVGLAVIVAPNITYNSFVSDGTPLAVTVSLVAGYSLSTVITLESQDIHNNPLSIQLTVEQLIQREARRAICDQAFGATLIGSSTRYITIDSLITSINAQLSSINGALAQILTNIAIAGGDIAVRNYNYSVSYLYYTYDIPDYAAISVSEA